MPEATPIQPSLRSWPTSLNRQQHFFVSAGNKAGFRTLLFVYIREAHPADSRWADRSGIDDPTDLVQRSKVAKKCCQTLDLSIPAAVDDMGDTVNQLYKAWQERIYVIDRSGKIAYKSAIGPWGFKPAQAERALRKLLKK